MLEEELHGERDRGKQEQRARAEEQAAATARLAGVEEALAQTRAAQRVAEAEAEQAWLQVKVYQRRFEETGPMERERGSGEAADKGWAGRAEDVETVQELKQLQTERQAQRMAALEEQVLIPSLFPLGLSGFEWFLQSQLGCEKGTQPCLCVAQRTPTSGEEWVPPSEGTRFHAPWG